MDLHGGLEILFRSGAFEQGSERRLITRRLDVSKKHEVRVRRIYDDPANDDRLVRSLYSNDDDHDLYDAHSLAFGHDDDAHRIAASRNFTFSRNRSRELWLEWSMS